MIPVWFLTLVAVAVKGAGWAVSGSGWGNRLVQEATRLEQQVSEIYQRVGQIPPWGFRVALALLVVTVLGVIIVWHRQKRIAQNQVELARLIQEISDK